eukprot:49946-Eustigmatos_ZCMA.PRE.1
MPLPVHPACRGVRGRRCSRQTQRSPNHTTPNRTQGLASRHRTSEVLLRCARQEAASRCRSRRHTAAERRAIVRNHGRHQVSGPRRVARDIVWGLHVIQ